MDNIDLTEFLSKHRLPLNYETLVDQWFYNLASDIASHHNNKKAPVTIGINGAQGSGKTTLTDLLVLLLNKKFHLHAVGLSIDDFYLTKQERKNLARDIHPLFITRGVPGTHDVKLASNTISQLVQGVTNIAIPRFDKASDDRYPKQQWEVIREKVDVVIFEGWCVGAKPQETEQLTAPINALEEEHDPQGIWRTYVNQKLSTDYPPLFDLIDYWIMFKAPSFDCVLSWRLEQEKKLNDILLIGDNTTMNDEDIFFFIQHYQRLTESLLRIPAEQVNCLFELNSNRQIVSMTQTMHPYKTY